MKIHIQIQALLSIWLWQQRRKLQRLGLDTALKYKYDCNYKYAVANCDGVSGVSINDDGGVDDAESVVF